MSSLASRTSASSARGSSVASVCPCVTALPRSTVIDSTMPVIRAETITSWSPIRCDAKTLSSGGEPSATETIEAAEAAATSRATNVGVVFTIAEDPKMLSFAQGNVDLSREPKPLHRTKGPEGELFLDHGGAVGRAPPRGVPHDQASPERLGLDAPPLSIFRLARAVEHRVFGAGGASRGAARARRDPD